MLGQQQMLRADVSMVSMVMDGTGNIDFHSGQFYPYIMFSLTCEILLNLARLRITPATL